MNGDIYNDSYRYYDEDESDIQINGNKESHNNKLNNMQRIENSGEPSSTTIQPSFSSSSLSSTSTSTSSTSSSVIVNNSIISSSSPVSVTTNQTNPNEQFNSYIHTNNGISNSINNINLKNNISSSKNFINNRNNFEKLLENHSNISTNNNSKLFSTMTTKIDNNTNNTMQHSIETTATTSVLNDTVYSSSTSNNILDILNDDNIVNSLIINDTFLNETNSSDIILNNNSSTINSSIIIDNLFNTSFNSISSYGIDTGGNYTTGYNNKNIINNNNNNYSILINKNDYNNGISLYSSISSTTLLPLSSIELDISYTPSMSQVLLAPTMSSLINYPVIPTDSTYIAMGSIANSATGGGGSSIGIPPANNAGLVTISTITETGIDSFYFYETEQFTVLWILFTVIVLGNTAVLLTLFLNKNRKSRMNFFIKQLAIADLCVGLLNVLTDIIWRITITWRAGNAACKIIRYSECCITYASTYVLVALSIDRYDAITHPMNFSGSWQRARRLVIFAWIVSCIFSLPILFLYEEAIIQGQSQCWIDLKLAWKWKLYMSLISLTLFFIPTVIISGCYAIIIRTIWVKGSVFVPAERTGRNSACMASRRASSRGIIPRAKVKTVKMTFVIVIVFVMCWSPYFVYNLWEVYYQPKKTQKSIAISTFIQSLAPLNSAANPLIYCLFSTQVCRALKRVPPFRWFSCLSCCNNQTNNNSSQHRCTTVNQRLHNSCDSMRTLTTSLNVSRRSNNCMRPARVVIVERPKTILAMSEV